MYLHFSSIYFADIIIGHSPPKYLDNSYAYKLHISLNTQHNPKGIWIKRGQNVQTEARKALCCFPLMGQGDQKRFTHQVAGLSLPAKDEQTQPAQKTAWILP